MSLIYKVLYGVGLTPWERGATLAAKQISALFDREENGRQPPYGQALDLGCGSGIWSVKLAQRGWQVTGIDIVPKAVRRARERAREAGVDVRFVQGDLTALRDAGVGSGIRFFLDMGAVHGLSQAQREAVGREVSAVATTDATMLIGAAPRRRLLPRGMSRGDIEATFPGWKVIDEEAVDLSGAPGPLKNAGLRWYRLSRQ